MMERYSEGNVWINSCNNELISLVNVECQFGDTLDFYRLEKHNIKGMNKDQAYEHFLENDNYSFETFFTSEHAKDYLIKQYGITIKL